MTRQKWVGTCNVIWVPTSGRKWVPTAGHELQQSQVHWAGENLQHPGLYASVPNWLILTGWVILQSHVTTLKGAARAGLSGLSAAG